jgi:hypothetical protein
MRVVIDCSTGGPLYSWADPQVEEGIGGSEECVILLARELVKLGHEVIVYNNCGPLEAVYAGVDYRRYDRERVEADVYVAWRNWHLLEGVEAPYKWLWCHDIPAACHCPSPGEIAGGALDHIGSFVLLNNYHKGIYVAAGIPEEKIIVAPIGVDPATYDVDVARDRTRVLYFSHPGRGLDRLRGVWPQVRAAVPDATLASFWWEPEHHRPANPGLGILPMAHLGYRDIAIETMRAGIFGYPCVFAPEISPATTIKAQFGGAVPVVVVQGGMVDTVKFGARTTQERFAGELISALKLSAINEMEDERTRMMQWARDTYSWVHVAALWSSYWKGDR